MTRLLCMGDTQLGVATVDLADQIAVLDRIGEVAVEERVDAVLHGGDVFEGPTVTPEQLRAFADFVASLRAHEIPVVAITGNGRHDAAMRETNGLAIFDHIPGIEISSRPSVDLIGGAVVGSLPWVHPGRLVAASNGGDRDLIHAEAARRLVRAAEGLAEACTRTGLPSVLLLHWSLSGATLPSGIPIEEAREPILELADLEALGFDAIIAAHVHRMQVLSEPGAPPAFYVGSPQPLNHGEAADEHGVWILELASAIGTTLRFVPVESRGFVTLDLDITETIADDEFDVPATFAVWLTESGHAAPVVRARIRASEEQWRRIDAGDVRRELLEAGAHRVAVQPEIVRASRARVEGVDDQLDEAAALELWIGTQSIDRGVAEAMRRLHGDYVETFA